MAVRFHFTPGNEAAKTRIAGILEGDKIPHAYLVEGPEGAGLFAFALDLALLRLCEGKGDRPCLSCPGCRRVLSNAHPDLQIYHPFPSAEAMKLKEDEYWEWMRGKITGLVEDPFARFSFDKESHIAIGTMRQMQENLDAGQNGVSRRIVILAQVDRMAEEAANSVLKILEEPRPGVLFLLTTSRPSMLLPTIISRCQILRLGELRPEEIIAFLDRRRPGIPAETVRMAAQAADGSLARALEALDGDLEPVDGLACAWIAAAEKTELAAAVELAEQLGAGRDGGLIRRVMELVLIKVREACILNSSMTPDRARQHVASAKGVVADLERHITPSLALLTRLRSLQRRDHAKRVGSI